MILHALDPGLRHLGLAEFQDGSLRKAYLIVNTERVLRGASAWGAMAKEMVRVSKPATPDVFVFERMKVYGKNDDVDPADLIELTGVGAWCAAWSGAAEFHSHLAREWKGTVPKTVHNKRVLGALTPTERTVVESVACSPSLLHNVIDAVGIGLYHTGRMGDAVLRAGKRK